MRLPRLRLRIRSLMIAVALIALAIAGGFEAARLRRIADGHRNTAAVHGRFAVAVRQCIARGQRLYTSKERPLSWAEMEQLAAYYDAMSLKYQRAARYPWLPAPPDPPMPGE